MVAPISYLFVPGSRPDRFAKALATAADAVIIDLEDAVAPSDKAEARDAVVTSLTEGVERPVYVRINAQGSEHFDRDVQALGQLPERAASSLAGIMLPKAEDPALVSELSSRLGVGVVALVETAVGVANIAELAAAEGTLRLALGAVDLSHELDAEITSATIDHVYAEMVVRSVLAGIPAPVASPPLSFTDTALVEQDARRLRGLGLTAQLCIHPAQLDPVHEGFLPTQEQIEWAQKIAATTDGASQLDGQMVDKPVQDKAARILELAKRIRN